MSDSSPEFMRYQQVYPKAVEAGLRAAAEVYQADVKERLATGYKGGRYLTGRAEESVRISETFTDGEDAALRVGSKDFVTYLWEVGFVHVGGRFERVEHWRNALDESGQAMTDAYQEAFNAVMESELG